MPRMNKTLDCKFCGQSFTPCYNTKGYCSNNCWLQYKHANKIGTSKGVKLSLERRNIQIRRLKKYVKDNGSWNKGLKGYKAGSEHYAWGKPRLDMRGENNPNWSGGISKRNQDKRLGQELKHWRKEVFSRDNFTCQLCKQHGGQLHADHIKSWAKYPELRYAVTNGRTLCQACHYNITFGKKMKPNTIWGVNKKLQRIT